MANRPSMLKAAAIGGASLGAFAALPFVSILQCACCSLVIGSGFLAAFLYSKDCAKANASFSAKEGALVGFIAAPFYALATVVVTGVVNTMFGVALEEAFNQVFDRMEEMGQEIPPNAEQIIEFVTEASPFVLLFLGFCFWLLIAAIFATIGGVIGGAVFKREQEPPKDPTDMTTSTMG